MDVAWIIFCFVIGSCVGSFLNVVIYRLPRGASIVFPGSHCTSCGRAIKWYDNIPLFSWLRLRAKCRFCHARISARYFVIELLTAVVVSGLYVCLFVLRLRDGAGEFADAWPMFAAHAALLCGLLACSAVDIELFVVPLPVMWFCAAVGIAAASFRPHQFLPPASAPAGLACVGAVAGLLIGEGLLRLGWLQPSFLDASDKPVAPTGRDGGGVAIGSDRGVDPRREILREVLFLGPAIVLGAVGFVAAVRVPAVRDFLDVLMDPSAKTGPAPHVASGMGAVVGLLVGAAWIWGARILGTLAFGKEAMGMGDVHILAAVGAVAGWRVASLTFFVAPFLGLLWGLYVLLVRGKRELPYGPWLAFGSLIVILFYDGIVSPITGGQ